MYSTPLMAERKVLPAQQFQPQREIGQIVPSMKIGERRGGRREGAGRPPKYKTEDERIAARNASTNKVGRPLKYQTEDERRAARNEQYQLYHHSEKGQRRYSRSQSIKREMRLQNDLLHATTPQSESM